MCETNTLDEKGELPPCDANLPNQNKTDDATSTFGKKQEIKQIATHGRVGRLLEKKNPKKKGERKKKCSKLDSLLVH